MRGTIIVGLMLCYCFSSAPAMAEFKSPFSIFSNKKEVKTEIPPVEENKSLNAKVEQAEQVEKKLKPKVVHDPNNILGVRHAENAVKKAEFYVEEGDIQSAQEALKSIGDWIYKATEYHTDLYQALSKVNNSEVQADIERDLAIQFAVLRDRTLFLESKVFLSNGKKREAVKNLVEVVRSQPGTELGFKAYKSLQDIGFTFKLEYEVIKENTDKGKQ